MPQPAAEEVFADPTASPADEDISVVILPQSEPPPSPSEPQPKSASSPPPNPSITPAPAPATLLPTNVIAEPVAPPPSVADLPPHPSETPPPEELPIEDGDRTPAFASPGDDDGPLLSYGEQFPHFEGATSGCLGLGECRQVSGVGTFRVVAETLIAGLESQGYGVDLRDDLADDTGRNVYELTPPGGEATKQFLLVFQGEEAGSAIYVMSPEIMTLDQLRSLAAQVTERRQAV
ncbi:hypothetical protein [Leptolyngbya iicbica]|uniref:Uncharacterized protein n=2 Tax=Cyanophyceae TaxID=3028117 RepID=A0A4Q7E2L1_9CYAN|nr:hypothetical protein [Leptolyngbya sp. LK]RZM76012.1 hypothetical protein DYY88_19145 [Leptolyngbya sp. LK]